MKTIVEGNKNIIRLLGKQKLKDVRYRLMRYVLKSEHDDGLLLHNAVTGQLTLLNKDETLCLESLPAVRTDVMNDLIENHFLVPIDYNEAQTVQTLRSLLKRFVEHDTIESYTILTTTNCNARCFYCYESNLPRINMDEVTADKLVNYMVDNAGKKTLKLHWFGGEPLVCSNRIDQICTALKDKSITYVSSMTSNGYLFNEELAEKAVSLWRLDSVQITLDGTESIYNTTKAYVNVSGSPFRRVLSNIQLLLDHNVRVIIRLNLDMHNIDDLFNLISEIEQTIRNRDRLEVYSHVLFEDAGFEPIARNDVSRTMLYIRQNELNTRLEKMGLHRNNKALPFLKTHNCMADADTTAAVFPDGRLFKCEHVELGDEYGSIDSGIVNPDGIEKFRRVVELDTCRSCPIYPSCILLKHCQGVSDKNRISCEYEVKASERTMNEHYRRFKEKSRM